MSGVDINMLVEMGFTKDRAEKALTMTGNKGVEPAMEWLLSNPEEEPCSSTSSTDVSVDKDDKIGTDVEAEKAEDGSEAKSLKCDECGKLFKSQLQVEYHAAKTGHGSFSESTEEKKPLTEEEKKEQLRLIEEKMKIKRKEREEKEKKEALEREKHRIQSGKEIAAMKKKMEEDEIKKMIDERKREKREEQMARQRVRDQIEADKAARKAKFGQQTNEPVTQTQPSPQPVAQKLPAVQKEYNETRLQIRLTNGQALTSTFGCKEQLSAVRLYIEMNRTDMGGPFNLMTNFPKKIFDEEDFEKPLDVLGLVPSAVIIVSKK